MQTICDVIYMTASDDSFEVDIREEAMAKHVTVAEQIDLSSLNDKADFRASSSRKSSRRPTFIPQAIYDEEEGEDAGLRVSKFMHIDDATQSIFKRTAMQHKETCKKPMKSFITGSKYIGEWNAMGMAGKGVYRYPHGVIYEGTFNPKGEFHGKGTLIYPNGTRFESMWKNGKLVGEPVYLTVNGTVMDKNYCEMPDRRFQIENERDFNAAGQEYITNKPPPPTEIPPDCYDSGEAFYDVKRKVMISYERKPLPVIYEEIPELVDVYFELEKKKRLDRHLEQLIKSSVSLKQEDTPASLPNRWKEDWIVRNCRHAWDEATGFRPDLYEKWTYGAKYERLKLADESLFMMNMKSQQMFQSKAETEKLEAESMEDYEAEEDMVDFFDRRDAHEHSRSVYIPLVGSPRKQVRFKSFVKRFPTPTAYGYTSNTL